MTTNEPALASSDVDQSMEGLHARVGRLAAVVSGEHYPAGDRAALRRYAPQQPVPLAFYRLWLRHLGTEPPLGSAIGAWALIAWGLATGGPSAHRRDRPLGRCLAEAGYSEARLERLLAAPEDDTRQALVASMVRYLASKGEGFDWVQLAQLVLLRDEARREGLHRRIATDYYRQLASTHKE